MNLLNNDGYSGLAMRLICYPTVKAPPVVRPAPVKRDWMTHTPDRFAYRCLPLAIANSHGWEILVDQPFAVTWSGGFDPNDMLLSFLDKRSPLPASHFGQGVLTFRVGYLFETEEQYNLWIMGPINYPKDGIMPLCGIVETDWAPYTFTMNWLFTRPGTVRFERGEPFCHFFPIPRHLLSTIGPEIRDLDKESEKSRIHTSWRTLRGGFLDRLKKGRLEPTDEVWDKHYFQGQAPTGEVLASDHETRLMVRPFVDLTSGQVARSEAMGHDQEATSSESSELPAAVRPCTPHAVRVVRAHFMAGESGRLEVAFPDPLLSASIYSEGRLDEVVQRAVAPFRLRLRQDPSASRCYAWFLRSSRGREHLNVRLHGPEDKEPEMRRLLEEAVEEFFASPGKPCRQEEREGWEEDPADAEDDVGTPFPDGTFRWTGYRRSDVSLGGGRLLLDDCYAALLTVCLARGCDLVLASVKPDGESGFTHGSRRTTLLRALVAGISALGFPLEKRFSYLAYHRDCVLRKVLGPGPRSDGVQKSVARLDVKAEASAKAIQGLRRVLAEEWIDDPAPDLESEELGEWQRSLSELLAYAGRFRTDVYQSDRWVVDPVFVPLFKAFHGIANQAGMTPLNEAFFCHLLVRARPEA